MKKFFSFAFMAVDIVACTLVSCGSDDDDEPSVSKDSYSLEALISDEILSLYDVTVTRTAGSDVKVYQFTKSSKIEHDETTTGVKSNGADVFSVNKGTHVTVKANLKLKSNWADIIKTLTDNSYLLVQTTYKTPKSSSPERRVIHLKKETATQEYLEGCGNSLTLNLAFDSEDKPGLFE